MVRASVVLLVEQLKVVAPGRHKAAQEGERLGKTHCCYCCQGNGVESLDHLCQGSHLWKPSLSCSCVAKTSWGKEKGRMRGISATSSTVLTEKKEP